MAPCYTIITNYATGQYSQSRRIMMEQQGGKYKILLRPSPQIANSLNLSNSVTRFEYIEITQKRVKTKASIRKLSHFQIGLRSMQWLTLLWHMSSPPTTSNPPDNPRTNLDRILSRVGRSAAVDDNYMPDEEEPIVTSSDNDSSEQDTPQPRPIRDGASYFLPSTEIAYRGNYIINLPDDPYGTCNREQAERIHHHYSVEYQKLCEKFDQQARVGGEEPPEIPDDMMEEEDIELPTGTMALLPENILALQEVFYNARGGKREQPNWLQRPTTERQIQTPQLICLQRILELNSLGTRGQLNQIMQRICCLDIFISQREQVKIVAQNAPARKRIRLDKQDRTRDTRIQRKVNDELLRLYCDQTRTTTTTNISLKTWLRDGKKWNCFFDDNYLRSCPLAMICLLPTDGKLTFSQKYPDHVWQYFVNNLHHLCPCLMDMAKSLENSIKSFRTSGRIQKPIQYWELMPAVDFHSVAGHQSVPHHEETEIAGPSQFAIGPRARPVTRTGIPPIRESQRVKFRRRVNVIDDPNEPAPTSSRGFTVEVRQAQIASEIAEEVDMEMGNIDVQASWMSEAGGATPAYRSEFVIENTPDLSVIPSSVADLDRDIMDVNMPEFLIEDLRRTTAVQVPCSDIGDNNSPVEQDNQLEIEIEENMQPEADWDSDYLFSITESDMERTF
ncbi:hypothetical protein DFP73DRAFT_532534 [Morchella snyderi]|nr:hypothetical protein DFP73DRAFT_532534 [Morchella snyderi]